MLLAAAAPEPTGAQPESLQVQVFTKHGGESYSLNGSSSSEASAATLRIPLSFEFGSENELDVDVMATVSTYDFGADAWGEPAPIGTVTLHVVRGSDLSIALASPSLDPGATQVVTVSGTFFGPNQPGPAAIPGTDVAAFFEVQGAVLMLDGSPLPDAAWTPAEESASTELAAPPVGRHTVSVLSTGSGGPSISPEAVFWTSPSLFDIQGAPTSAAPGDALSLSIAGLAAGATVSFELHSDPVVLATVTADATGTASARVTIPAVPAGVHALVAVVTDPGGRSVTASVPITIRAASGAAVSAAGGSSAGALAATGSDPALPLASAAMVFVAGAAVLLVVRRRLRPTD